MNLSVTFAFILIYFMMFCHQDAIGVPDTCGTQFYAQGVSKLFYGSSRSSAIKWSRTIKTNTVDSTGTRTIIAFYCFTGSSSCEPDDTTKIFSNGDVFVTQPGSNKLYFVTNVCWPIGTVSRTGPILTRYENNTVISLLGEPFEVKVYKEYFVDTLQADTSMLHWQLLSDSLGIVGAYEPNQREYTTLLLGAVIDGVPYGVTTSVNLEELTKETRGSVPLVHDSFLLPSWVTSFPNGSVTLYNTQGQTLLRQNVSNPILDVSTLSHGVYFVVPSEHRVNELNTIIIFVN